MMIQHINVFLKEPSVKTVYILSDASDLYKLDIIQFNSHCWNEVIEESSKKCISSMR